MSTKQERKSTFELLRLILMFMIVLEHSLMVLTLHNYEPLSVCILIMFVCIGIDKLIEYIGKMFKVDKVYEAANNSALNRAINDSK